MHPCWRKGSPSPRACAWDLSRGPLQRTSCTLSMRLLFRATRGNMFLKFSSVGTVVDPTTTEKVEKAVFVVFFAGERAPLQDPQG